jgi:acyl transferase domain-containing protein/acyl-CoA synthetase (AMP-forming)/AMP-acid ligase II
VKITADDYLVAPPTAGLLGLTLPEVFASAAGVAPDAVAVTDANTSWTWRQWQTDSQTLAAGLQRRGVQPGDVVAIRLPNGWEFLTAHIAVAAVGAVMLPLHMALGAADVRALLDRVEPVLVLDTETWAPLLAAGTGRKPDPVTVRPDMPLLVMPSSGTTSARSKLSLHTHDATLSNAAAITADGLVTEADVLLSASPFTHGFALGLIHLTLFTRARQVLLPQWEADALVDLATGTGATVLYAVPTQLGDLVRRLDTRSTAEITLRWVRTGGASVPASLIEDLRRATGAQVIVQWGMSEVWAGTYTRQGDPDETVSTTIGTPVAGARVRVVDGELQLRGPSMFRGYLGEPELTGAAVTEDGWLRTGDRAEIGPDGRVRFLGRSSETINVGGRKFAACEVEDLLARFGRVAVVGRPDDRLGEYPCLVVDQPGITLTEVTELLRVVGLAEYKIPLELVTVEAIPLTPFGKISRRLVTELLAERDTEAGLLKVVRGAAARVLGRDDPIAPGMTFREYGIDSASAIRLRNEIVAATGRPLPTGAVFDYPTPRELVRWLFGDHHIAPQRVARTGEDPVVIMGLGCRLPGGIVSPEHLWQTLLDGREIRTEFPTDRGWPADLHDPDPAASYGSMTPFGGFIDHIDAFDHRFFGVSPREARSMDPQQRLLLEVCWEALERAGISAESVKGSDTGVFVGMMPSDYGPRWTESPVSYDGTLVIGTAPSVASGRLAYFLGVHGPAVTVDTACSSGLSALHLAVTAIERDECATALVGAASLMCTPAPFVEFSRQRVLSPDGRCKAFAAGADGAAWSEGVAAVVVTRLSEARRLGRPVLAVVRGSAVNHDGASNGLTAPNGPAQQDVIRRALHAAGLAGGDIDAIEAHGTGTALGDPIEAHALAAVYGTRERPLWLGSVKSNLGHTQAAAGLVGVLKMVLAMGRGVLPKTLHVDAPSPHVDWSAGPLRLVTETMPWPDSPGEAGPRRAGVSAFGISGTNAHVLLEHTPVSAFEVDEAADPVEPAPWLLSARTPSALRTSARRLCSAVDDLSSTEDGAVARALAARTSFEHRAVLFAGHRQALRALADGRDHPGLVVDHVRERGPIVFVFPGMGSQWPGMARELLTCSPAFAEAFAECEQALSAHIDWSPSELLRTEADLTAVDILQPVLFAVMVSLARLWMSRGVVPDAVVGHSLGEVAAAHIAGGLSLADAARVIAVRGMLQARLAGRGTMAWLPLPPDSGAVGERLTVSAVNDPRSVVVCGSNDDITAAVAATAGATLIRGSYPSHCPMVAELRAELLAGFAGIRPTRGTIPFYSTVTANELDTAELTADYWYRNVRERVEFARTTARLAEQGHQYFVEISPHPVLTNAIEQTADVTTVPTLRRGEGGPHRFTASLALAGARGVDLRWEVGAGDMAELPTYPFERERHWLGETTRVTRSRPSGRADLLRAVQESAAAVSGNREPLPADATFQANGFTSLLAVELRDRLARLLDRRLPATVVFDHDTPASLAAHLAEDAPTELPSGFEQVYRMLCATGASAAAADMVREASRLRPAFTAAQAVAPQPVRLAGGPATTVVVCFPSLLAMSAPAEYAPLADALAGSRDVHALPQPGYVDGQPLPVDLDALVAAHTAAVTAAVGDRPYVLCGHSSGGWIAHLVAERITGRRLRGVVLLDSPWPSSGFVREEVPRMFRTFIEREQATGVEEVGMTRLTAMGGYLRIVSEWSPVDPAVPVLHVAAVDGARWQLPHQAAEVPGDHFTMIGAAATVVAQWLHDIEVS